MTPHPQARETRVAGRNRFEHNVGKTGDRRFGDGMSRDRTRWHRRPALSLLLRALVVATPVGAAFGVALALSRILPRPDRIGEAVMWWAVVTTFSFLTLLIIERLLRRLAPLAVLLQMSLAFPDRAPSRFAIARRAWNPTRLKREVLRAREAGVETDGIRAVEILLALSTALSSHDPHTRGHSERVRVYADMLGEELDLPPEDRDRLRWAALLHDIGKLSVPRDILNKEAPLQADEWDVIRRHPREGAELVRAVMPWLGDWARAIEQHHERWDGRGYPDGLVGEQIWRGARVVMVADAYETMTAPRPYRPPLGPVAAREELARWAGKQFDPAVVRALFEISIGRLWRAAGLRAWLGQIPILGRLQQMGQRLGTAGTQAAVDGAKVATVVVVAGLTGATLPGGVAESDAPPPEIRVEDGEGSSSVLFTTTDDRPARGAREVRRHTNQTGSGAEDGAGASGQNGGPGATPPGAPPGDAPPGTPPGDPPPGDPPPEDDPVVEEQDGPGNGKGPPEDAPPVADPPTDAPPVEDPPTDAPPVDAPGLGQGKNP